MHGFGTLSITVAYLAAGVASMPSMSSMPSFSLFGWPRFCAKPLNGPWHITCDTCNVVTATMSCLACMHDTPTLNRRYCSRPFDPPCGAVVSNYCPKGNLQDCVPGFKLPKKTWDPYPKF